MPPSRATDQPFHPPFAGAITIVQMRGGDTTSSAGFARAIEGEARRGPARPPSMKRCRWVIFIAPLYALEVTDELPVRNRLIKRLLLQSRRMQVMLDNPLAKCRPRHLRALELGDRLAQRLRHLRQRRILVGVAVVRLGRLQLALDAVQAGGDGGRERQVGVRVGAGDPVLDTERRALAAQPEAAGAIVPADGDAGRREGPRLVSLVRVDAGRVEV